MTASPGSIRAPSTIASSATSADRAAAQLPAGDDVADLGDLAARDLDPGELGAAAAGPTPIRSQTSGFGLAAEDEVEHRDRLRADADQVVDVHRDAVDPDRVEAPEPLGDDHLRADAVGGEGDPGPLVDPQHARVVARAARRPATACRCRSGRGAATSAATAASAWRWLTPARAYASCSLTALHSRPRPRPRGATR